MVIEMKFLKHIAFGLMMVGALSMSVSAQRKDPPKKPPKPPPPDVKPGGDKRPPKPAPTPRDRPKKPGMEFSVFLSREVRDLWEKV